ncbi:hypothetical protein DIPPA_01304 [Diplonema papillatum]|nr:hypothetical protein DIPPA_01304 [Diplonema papillatum]
MSSRTIRVASWNLRGNRDGFLDCVSQGPLSHRAVGFAEVLRTVDILGLQEVRDMRSVEHLMREVGLRLAARAEADFSLGNALFVRQGSWDVCATFDWKLMPDGAFELRSAAAVELWVPPRRVLVVCTHLDHRSEDLRLAQFRLLRKQIAEVVDRCEAEHNEVVDRGLECAGKQQLQDTAFAKGALSKEGHEKATQALKDRAAVPPTPEENREPIDGVILLGDFNSLSLSDYETDEEVAALRVRREKAGVEQPCFSVVRELEHENLVDTRSLARSVTGPLSTSHFGVRVDYIFVSRQLHSILHAVPSHETIEVSDDVSDHNLVITTLEISADSRSGKPQDVGTIFCRQ